jgi:cobalt-zinc-cadmium efflux system membrane fusion protein
MKNISKIIMLFAIIAIISSCKSNKSIELENKESFVLSDTLEKLIKVDEASLEKVSAELILTGKVSVNEEKMSKIYPFAGGIVESLKAELGDYVKKGQVLAVVRSSEVADYENQLNAAKSNLSIAKKNMEVADELFKSGLNSEKDVNLAKNEFQKAEGDVSRIKNIMNIYSVGVGSTYQIKAPISGFITEKNVSPSMQFRTDNPFNFFTIADLDSIWVLANVYENDIDRIQLNYQAKVSTLANPDKEYIGKIDKIYNLVDPTTRVLKVVIKLKNTNNELKPEMFANVKLDFNEPIDMVTIPSNAVIFDKNKFFVMVYHDKHNIETREVVVHKNINGKAYIQSGIKAGEKVISSYQLLVYDAIND